MLHEAKQTLRGHGQLENLDTERCQRICERIGNSCRRADCTALAHPAKAAHSGRGHRVEMYVIIAGTSLATGMP